jgi:microcystin-dependent protein
MSEPFLGEIRMFAGNFAPQGWAFCDGQFLPISENDALFALMGTTYGGDGQTTFRLPDLRGRFPMHQGSGPGLNTRVMGESGGTESETLTVQQIPNHSHLARAAAGGNKLTPGGNFWSTDPGGNTAAYTDSSNNVMAPGAIALAGGSQPHGNVQPFLCVNFIIALFGIFPSQT